MVIFDHISHLPNVETGMYYRPSSKTYETIDAFLLMDGALWDAKFKGTILVLIQVTVSKSHKVDGSVVKSIHRDVYKKWKGVDQADSAKRTKELPFILVFATRKYPEGVQTYQNAVKGDEEAYVSPLSVIEYSMVLERDFEAVWTEVDKMKRKF
jgi:hypothetical protein